VSAERPDRLIYMANQIARFFTAQPEDAAAATASHLRSYWAPEMRSELGAWVAAGGDGLDSAALAAVRALEPAPQSGP
jgi:formate dehydrogenase subunit delta